MTRFQYRGLQQQCPARLRHFGEYLALLLPCSVRAAPRRSLAAAPALLLIDKVASVSVRSQLQDADAGYGREIAIIREKAGAAGR